MALCSKQKLETEKNQVAKENELLQSLLKLIRYDAMEGFVAPAIGKQEVLRLDYDTSMRKLWGQKNEKLTRNKSFIES